MIALLAVLAALLSAGPAWALSSTPYRTFITDGSVDAIARSGGTVCLGGQNKNLAALDAVTGSATAWRPDPNSDVDALLVAADGTLYAGGYFTTMELAPQAGFAAFSPTP